MRGSNRPEPSVRLSIVGVSTRSSPRCDYALVEFGRARASGKRESERLDSGSGRTLRPADRTGEDGTAAEVSQPDLKPSDYVE